MPCLHQLASNSLGVGTVPPWLGLGPVAAHTCLPGTAYPAVADSRPMARAMDPLEDEARAVEEADVLDLGDPLLDLVP